MSQTGSTGRPGRYSRSFGGLVGAMIVTVVGVLAFVGVRSLVGDNDALEPEPVDYLSDVRELQAADVDVVYPRELPAGWTVSDVDLRPGDPPTFGLGMVTDDTEFVGLAVDDAPVDDLLEALVDEDYQDRDPLVLTGADAAEALAPRWEGFGDEGGDTAYAAEVDGRQVLVYGSAAPEQLATVVTLLTDEPVPDADADADAG